MEEKTKEISVFDFVNMINFKKPIDNLSIEDIDNKYLPFIINKQFSYTLDTVLLANEMNKNSHIDNDMQLLFYFFSVEKGKRFSKWHKPPIDNIVDMLMEVYKISRKEALIYSKLFKNKDREKELTKFYKEMYGGRKK